MIGVVDSGSGGLSVLKEMTRLLPGEKYLYYSDNAWCPYGEKTRDFIIERMRAVTDFLLGKGADIIVVACNTATSAAISTLREEFGSACWGRAAITWWWAAFGPPGRGFPHGGWRIPTRLLKNAGRGFSGLQEDAVTMSVS